MALNMDLSMDHFVLPNGLEVVLHRDPAATSALVHVRYHVGSKDDPVGRAGFAHFFEHLMFRGARYTKAKDYSEWVDEVGGKSNAVTTLDSTDYYAQVPPGAVTRALWLEADRMAYPLDALDAAAFSAERDVVKNEWREHYDDVTFGNVSAIAREEVFGVSHPYGARVIGNGAELDAVTLPEARAFARAFYRPNNATLVVCGAIDYASVRAFITPYFATIPPGQRVANRSMPPPRVEGTKYVHMVAGVDTPAIAYAWAIPPTHADGSEELRYALSVVAGGLRRRLVTEKKTAIEVDKIFDQAQLGGLAMLLVKLQPKGDVDEVTTVLEEVLSSSAMIGRSRTWESFRDYKTQVLVSDLMQLESMGGRARAILHGLDYHQDPNRLKVDLRRMQEVKAEDVGSAVERFFVDRPHVTIRVAPTPDAPRAGRRRS